MFILAMLLISGGYTILYWGIDNLVAWVGADSKESQFGPGISSLSGGTLAMEMSILAGVSKQPGSITPGGAFHDVPFPYHPTKTSGQSRPIDTTPAQPGANPNPVRPV